MSVLSDGHQGFGFSDQYLIEVSALFGTTIWVSRAALLELSVLRRLSITDFVVILRFVFAHNLLITLVFSAVECFASCYMYCVELRLPLPSTNNGVDVEWIKL